MDDNQEKNKKPARKGMPHQQGELPGFPEEELLREEPSPDAETPITEAAPEEGQTVPPAEGPAPRETRAIREQKRQSVIRNRFLHDDEEDESMLEQVVDNLLNNDAPSEADIAIAGETDDDEIEQQSGEVSAEVLQESAIQEEEALEVPVEPEIEPEVEAEVEEDTIQVPEDTGADRERLAKRYEAIHNKLFVIDLLVTISAILLFLLLGGSSNLRNWIFDHLTSNNWVVPIVYAAIVTIVYYFVFLIPMHAMDFHFEKKFKLSTQSFGSWLEDNFKSLFLNMLLMMLFLELIYFFLRLSAQWWWVWAAGAWVLFGVLMANLLPVLILPLFYKLKPLKNQSLRDRLEGLVGRVRMKVVDIYEIELSRKTRKANAMLAGLGNTKRIILGDTLLENFSEEEIETIIAHELGHHYHRHIQKLIAFGTVITFAGFFVASQFLKASIGWLGYLDIMGVDDIAGFPLLLISIFVFGLLTMPVSNYISRALERQADRFSLRLTDRPSEFISAMRKIADQNLADKEPSPAIEFLLHDHPSISKRVAAAEDYSSRKRV